MAQRKTGKPAAPVKQRLRKNHGPKRKMFHCWDSTTRIAFAKAGILTKYHNFESFAQYCAKKNVRSSVEDLWYDFIKLDTMEEKNQYFKDIVEHSKAITAAKEKASGKKKTK